MDQLMDVIRNSEEPEWLERDVVGNLRLWQVLFLALAGFSCLVVMVCCCFRFRIPRTKQQIEADFHRRKITAKFRQHLDTIQDSTIDAMSLDDVLELLHEKHCKFQMENENEGFQPSSLTSQQPSSMNASAQVVGGQKPEPQVSGMNFVKFASKVANINKLTQPRSPTSPSPSTNNKMDF